MINGGRRGMACDFIGWCALPLEAQAAWAQAVMSALAILVAASIPWLHGRHVRRRRIDMFVEMLSFAESWAIATVEIIERAVGRPIADNDPKMWSRIVGVFNQIPYHQLPDYRLFSILHDAGHISSEIETHYLGLLSASRLGLTVRESDAQILRGHHDALLICYEKAASISNSLAGPLGWTKQLKQRLKKVFGRMRRNG